MAPEPDGARRALTSALTALYARVPLGMRLGLEPMREACARAGHPERAFPAVHVTGTNGKGSTCAMIEAMARAAGMRTGLYTSPHLCRFAERIRLGGEPIDDAALARVLERALALGPDLSFFEAATLAAFLAFQEAAVELAVIEVGIGGRLDATNVLPAPRCAAITRVALDHQDRLGDTLEAIAREKAGIAKPGAPMVLGALPPGARAAAIAVARAAGARVVERGEHGERELPADAVVPPGGYQRDNARVAWRVAGELGLPEDARRRGLASARWPGRFERLRLPAEGAPPLAGEVPPAGDAGGPGDYLLDGAHNADGARALVDALRGDPPGAVVFGALADKAWPEMLRILAELPAERFYAEPRGRAAARPDELAKVMPGTPCASLAEALDLAARAARGAAGGRGLVLVCGSLYLIGEARARILGLPQDPPVSL